MASMVPEYCWESPAPEKSTSDLILSVYQSVETWFKRQIITLDKSFVLESSRTGIVAIARNYRTSVVAIVSVVAGREFCAWQSIEVPTFRNQCHFLIFGNRHGNHERRRENKHWGCILSMSFCMCIVNVYVCLCLCVCEYVCVFLLVCECVSLCVCSRVQDCVRAG